MITKPKIMSNNENKTIGAVTFSEKW